MELEYRKAVEVMSRKVIEAFKSAKRGDYSCSISILDEILANEIYPDLRRDAFGYRALFFEDIGRFDEAKADLLSSCSLIPPDPIGAATFARSVTEQGIGRICEKQSKIQEAKEWYMKALMTIKKGDACDGGSALKSLLTLVGEGNLSDEARALCNAVAIKSWKLLRIPGEPDLNNLAEATQRIIEAMGKPRPKE
jgi:tetratricopeptide (TPR) repeat protein